MHWGKGLGPEPSVAASTAMEACKRTTHRCETTSTPEAVAPRRRMKRLRRISSEELEVPARTRKDGPVSSCLAPSFAASSQSSKQEDSDAVFVSRCISLVDPVSLRRMRSPVRGRQCDHVQAFDRQAYIEFNKLMERDKWCKLSRRWKCPICNKHVSRNDLVRATNVRTLLEQADLEDMDVVHALLLPDGTLALPPRDAVPRAEQSPKSATSEVDDSEDEVCCSSPVLASREESTVTSKRPRVTASSPCKPGSASRRSPKSLCGDGLMQMSILAYGKTTPGKQQKTRRLSLIKRPASG